MNDVLLIVLAWLNAGTPRPAASNPGPAPRVVVVVDRNMRDAAMAVADPVRPVIYINPSVLDELEPPFVTFVLRHEHAHIRFGHQRPDRNQGTTVGVERLLRSYELAADCLAAAELGSTQPDAVSAAVRFFAKLGATRIDAEHPAGNERAAMIRACSTG